MIEMKEKILNDILNQFNHMKSEDMALLKKLIMAYDLGVEKIDAKVLKNLDEVYDFYLEKDYITSFVNPELVEKFEQIMKSKISS